MKLSLVLFTTAILGIQQAIAAPASFSHTSASLSQIISNSAKASPAAALTSLVAPTPSTLPLAPEGAIAIDKQLVHELGWSNKDTELLTGFLNAIERLGDLTQQAIDPSTKQLLLDFQAEARELIAHAGYKFQLTKDGSERRRVLTRMSAVEAADNGIHEQEGITDVIANLVHSLTTCMEKLKKKADSGSVVAQKIYTVLNNILTTIGKKIEEHLFPSPKPASSTPAMATARVPYGYPTFLY